MNPYQPPAPHNSTIEWKKVIIDRENLWQKGQHRIMGTIVPHIGAKCPFKGEMVISNIKVQADSNSLWPKYTYRFKCERGKMFTQTSARLIYASSTLC